MGVQKIFDNTTYCEMCTDRPAIKRFRGVVLCDDCLGVASSIEVIGKNWESSKKEPTPCHKQYVPCPACKKPIWAYFYTGGGWIGTCERCKQVWRAKGDGSADWETTS